MTGKQMIKLFKRHGWTIVKVTGSHYKMRRYDKTETIPHHTGELRKGLQEHLLKRLKEVD